MVWKVHSMLLDGSYYMRSVLYIYISIYDSQGGMCAFRRLNKSILIFFTQTGLFALQADPIVNGSYGTTGSIIQ